MIINDDKFIKNIKKSTAKHIQEDKIYGKEYLAQRIKKNIEFLDYHNAYSVLVVDNPNLQSISLALSLMLTKRVYAPVSTLASAFLIEKYASEIGADLIVISKNNLKNYDVNSNDSYHLIDFNGFIALKRNKEKISQLLPGVVFQSSGTTATPKMALHDYDTIEEFLTWCISEFKFYHKDVFLFSTPLSFIGSLRPLFLPILSGAECVLQNKSIDCDQDVITYIDIIYKHQVTVLNITPSFLKWIIRVIKHYQCQYKIQSIKTIILSGEPVEVVEINYWYSINPKIVFYNLYGASEYLVPFYNKITSPLSQGEGHILTQQRPNIYYFLEPFDNRYFRLCIHGGLARGYLKKSLNSRYYKCIEKRRFFMSDDLVCESPQGISLIGRAHETINHLGYTINLQQIKSVVSGNLNINRCEVIYTNKPAGRIHLFIESQDKSIKYKVNQIINRNLPRYMHPHKIHIKKSLPISDRGKIDIQGLRLSIEECKESQVESILKYLQLVLNDDAVNGNTMLSEIGFTSLDYINLIQEIYTKTNQWIDVSQVNQSTTINQLSNYINITSHNGFKESRPLTLNFSQKILHYASMYNVGPGNFYFVLHHKLKSTTDLERLDLAIQETSNNHFMLKCKLNEDRGEQLLTRTLSPEKKFSKDMLCSDSYWEKNALSFKSDPLCFISSFKKGGDKYLLIAYHHCVLDGWSLLHLREEIFSRYENDFHDGGLDYQGELLVLKKVQYFFENEKSNINNIKRLYHNFKARKYTPILDSIFSSSVQTFNSSWVLSAEKFNHFKEKNKWKDFSNSSIFLYLMYSSLSFITGLRNINIYLTLSQRNIPVWGVRDILTYMSILAPLPLCKDVPESDFITKIQNDTDLLFRNIYGKTIIDVWEMNEMKSYLNYSDDVYGIIFTYVNLGKKNCIQNSYIDWSNSTNTPYSNDKKRFFLRVFEQDKYLIVNVHAKINPHFYKKMIDQFNMYIDKLRVS